MAGLGLDGDRCIRVIPRQGQGNIFAPVCHSVHRLRVPGPGGCLILGVSALGGAWSQGGAWFRGGCLVLGGAWWRPPWDGYCCGRYASYWNAFLFFFCFLAVKPLMPNAIVPISSSLRKTQVCDITTECDI